ncbi:MAG: hypothetical protein EOO37_03075 [Cytophagaceae bacterium]|nr:MAG: hypothetical protein EOO37_03075 [Cytophagaceae bacterium]
MQHLLLISLIGSLAFVSCNNAPAENKPKDTIPKALEDQSLSYEMISKRGADDLVESLYKELMEKKPALKELENKLDGLPRSEADSTEIFNSYISKNQAFYNSAHYHAAQIKDSLLRRKMESLVAISLASYDASIFPHKEILKAIETKKLTLNDLHTVLKITTTLPIIINYQKANLPRLKPLKGYYKKVDETTKHANSLIEK